jgi:chromosome segregation ATPase
MRNRIREIKANNDKDQAILQQKIELKNEELRGVVEKYEGICKLYEKTVESINKSDRSEEISRQLKINRDLHMKQIIDLKGSQSNELSKLHDRVDKLSTQKRDALKKIEQLEEKYDELYADYSNLSDSNKLDKKEYELKIEILTYEKQKAEENLENFTKEQSKAHLEEIERIRKAKNEEIDEITDVKNKQIEEFKLLQNQERETMERRIVNLQFRLKDVINNICKSIF